MGAWRAYAACQNEPLELFFAADGERQPEREIRERAAKEVCARCPVRTQCLDYAIAGTEKYGVWGGLNEEELASERRRRPRRRESREAAA